MLTAMHPVAEALPAAHDPRHYAAEITIRPGASPGSGFSRSSAGLSP